MANTIYTQVNYFDKGLTAFSKEVSLVDAFSTRFEPVQIHGASLSVPLITAGSAGEFNGTYSNDSDTISEIDVPLKHLYKAFSINVTEASTNAAAVLENLYKANLEALSVEISETITAPLTGLSDSEAVTVSGFDFATIKGLAQDLDTTDVPSSNRALLLRGQFATALTPETSDNLRLSVEDYGFKAYRNNALPASHAGFAIHPGICAVGAALPNNPILNTSYVIDSEVIIDPATNLPIQFFVYADPGKGKVMGIFETYIGSAIAQNKGVKLTYTP